MNTWKFTYITSGFFRELMEVQVLLGGNRCQKLVWKEKETKSPSSLYYLDKFDRYSNLFLGIVYQLRDQ